ncbi:CGNR zinc finger domain-containing protein [Nocardiopsis codii]|uniref:CGNR zinc finger domain-containing protein n=1 Tax=Nocardiopsis codii TaxID=3065942 RepID=UPI0038B2E7DF
MVRLKSCAEHTCREVFWDGSKNRSRRGRGSVVRGFAAGAATEFDGGPRRDQPEKWNARNGTRRCGCLSLCLGCHDMTGYFPFLSC